MKPRARVFWLHVHAFDEGRGRVWAVQTAGRYLTARDVDVRVPLETRFRGRRPRTYPKLKAFLRGRGVVRRRRGGVLEIARGPEPRARARRRSRSR